MDVFTYLCHRLDIGLANLHKYNRPQEHIQHKTIGFYPAALKGSGVLSYPERAGGRAGGRQGRQAPLTLSRPYFFTDHFQT